MESLTTVATSYCIRVYLHKTDIIAEITYPKLSGLLGMRVVLVTY